MVLSRDESFPQSFLIAIDLETWEVTGWLVFRGRLMKSRVKLAGLFVVTVCAGLATGPSRATTYLGSESFDGATVQLSITTDGVVGPVASSNILSWDITITDPSGQFELTPANSDANVINILTGTDLTASATELTYNFSFDGGLFLIESPHIGANGPFWCLNAGGTNCWGVRSRPELASAPKG